MFCRIVVAEADSQLLRGLRWLSNRVTGIEDVGCWFVWQANVVPRKLKVYKEFQEGEKGVDGFKEDKIVGSKPVKRHVYVVESGQLEGGQVQRGLVERRTACNEWQMSRQSV